MGTNRLIALFSVSLAIALTLGVGACRDNEFQPPPPPSVTVALPAQRDVVEHAEFTGTTEAFKTVEVRARVQGILQEIIYTPGEEVEEGAPLFRIDPALFVAARDAAQAKVKNEEARVEVADAIVQRTDLAASRGAATEFEVLEAHANAAAAAAQLDMARKDLAIKQLDVDYTFVRAPIAGRVARSPFNVGSLVGGFESSLLTTVYDDSKVYAWFSVPDRVFLRARRDKGADADGPFPKIELATEIDDGFPRVGQVDYADPTVDAETGTLRVRAVFENGGREGVGGEGGVGELVGELVGGLFVRCRLEVGMFPGALLLPETAIGVDQIGSYVFVVDAQGTVERRDVELGPLDGELRVIASGVGADDRVVVRGLLRARPGAKVNAQEAGA